MDEWLLLLVMLLSYFPTALESCIPTAPVSRPVQMNPAPGMAPGMAPATIAPPGPIVTTTTVNSPATTTTTLVTTTSTTTTTTVAPIVGCCPELVQTLTTTEFADGQMTFTYNNNTCRTMVTMFCTQTDPAFDLEAAILANQLNFLSVGAQNTTFPGTCNGTSMQWLVGVPPLTVMNIQCILSNPPAAG